MRETVHGRPVLVTLVLALFFAALLGGLIILPFGTVSPSWLWIQAPFVVLAGASTGLLLAEREEPADAGRLLLVLLLGPAVLLAGAAAVGAPFTGLRFTRNLGPHVAGIPLGIPFLWLAVVGGALATARSLMGPPRPGRGDAIRQATLAASLATLVSLSLDPVARVMLLWSWHRPGAFDGAPLISFVGWWTTTLVLGVTALGLAPSLRLVRRPAAAGPILVLLSLQALVVTIALRSGRVVALLGGTTTLVILGYALLRARGDSSGERRLASASAGGEAAGAGEGQVPAATPEAPPETGARAEPRADARTVGTDGQADRPAGPVPPEAEPAK